MNTKCTYILIAVSRASISSIKGKQGREQLPGQRLRQAMEGKGEGTSGPPVSTFQTAGSTVCTTTPNAYAVENELHACPGPTAYTPALRYMAYYNPTTRDKAETEYTAQRKTPR